MTVRRPDRAVAISCLVVIGLSIVALTGCGSSTGTHGSSTGTHGGGTSTSTSSVAAQIATSYHLEGDGVTITYLPHGGSATGEGAPQISYAEPGLQKTVSGSEIRTVTVPGLGDLVTFNTRRYVPFGEATFSIIIPLVTVWPTGEPTRLSTEGIRTVFNYEVLGPGQRQHYTVVHLVGEARRVR